MSLHNSGNSGIPQKLDWLQHFQKRKPQPKETPEIKTPSGPEKSPLTESTQPVRTPFGPNDIQQVRTGNRVEAGSREITSTALNALMDFINAPLTTEKFASVADMLKTLESHMTNLLDSHPGIAKDLSGNSGWPADLLRSQENIDKNKLGKNCQNKISYLTRWLSQNAVSKPNAPAKENVEMLKGILETLIQYMRKEQ